MSFNPLESERDSGSVDKSALVAVKVVHDLNNLGIQLTCFQVHYHYIFIQVITIYLIDLIDQ